ncbi:hypothetical protein MUK42_27487 [Musa troglodytarum]|uniref:Uncharacterized protein n=1 Tax=Musa troglodytarum TaxID=320322 RepID=A0A9E7F8G7_9LILI|nr:hypothetical protein MUK42_27487 [Musa troglodytarum]
MGHRTGRRGEHHQRVGRESGAGSRGVIAGGSSQG